MEQKIAFDKNIKQKEELKVSGQAISGPVCPLPASKGTGIYKGGAVTSAFMSVFL